MTDLKDDTEKKVEKFVNNIEKNILNFSLNKCVADIYTLFNYLEKENIYLYNNKLSNKILICIFPIIPTLSISLNKYLFNSSNFKEWPSIKPELLVEDEINLPVAARLSPNLSISLVNEFNNFPCFSELIYSHPALKIEL